MKGQTNCGVKGEIEAQPITCGAPSIRLPLPLIAAKRDGEKAMRARVGRKTAWVVNCPGNDGLKVSSPNGKMNAMKNTRRLAV